MKAQHVLSPIVYRVFIITILSDYQIPLSPMVKIEQNRPTLSGKVANEDFPVKFQIRRSQYEEFSIFLFTKITSGISGCTLHSSKFTLPRKNADGSEIMVGTIETDPGYEAFLTDFINIDTGKKAPEILKIAKNKILRTSEYARMGNYKTSVYCYR